MGMWGFEPWEDDLAADWFADLFGKGKVAERVEKALGKKDVEEYWPEIRAAAHVVSVLGDVWPHERFEAHHRLAIEKLEAVKRTSEFDGDAMMGAEIDAQIAVLRGRLAERAGAAAPPDTGAVPPKYDYRPAVARLTSADPKERLAGLRWIGKQANGGSTQWTIDWLNDPATAEAHIPLMADPDPDVVEQAIINLYFLAGRHARSEKTLPGAVRLLKSDSKNARSVAVGFITQFDHERFLDDLLPLFADPDKDVRERAIKETGSNVEKWSAESKARLLEAARKALADRADGVKCAAAGTVGFLGGEAELPTLRKVKATIKGAGWKREMNEIIATTQKGRWGADE